MAGAGAAAADAGGYCGIETEYGVLGPSSNPVLLSTWVVEAYKGLLGDRLAAWDYGSEDPLNDARGFRIDRAAAHPSLLTDDPNRLAPPGDSAATALQVELRGADAVVRGPARLSSGPGAVLLPNGGRLYVDHAHPEYATPEVAGARAAALWDKAGERVMARAAAGLERAGTPVSLYKNNTDGKGASYGTHENYLVARDVPFEQIIAVMTTFLVTRQIYTGSGRVGLGQRSQEPGFQLSQRADYVEAEVGLETTLNRPIVNTRDEPHADATRWRRLHVIVGDATLMDVATYVRVGTCLAVLRAMETKAFTESFLRRVRLADPVAAFHQVSRDLTVAAPLALAAGGTATAVELQREYLQAVADGAPAGLMDEDVLARWAGLLDGLASDPLSQGRQIEWVAKYQLLDGLRRRSGLTWGAPKLAAADLQWSDVNPARSLFRRVEASGAVEVLFDEAAVADAIGQPPETTRAYLKGQAVRRFGQSGVPQAGWDSLTLAWDGGAARVALPSPSEGTKARIGVMVEAATGPAKLAELLARA
ncbi:MAG: proteasome accessory factor PafA2 [Bifidobacteriaceae bacterium]|nr:proteasome accessory factor PafA2 [Bifidobacteriaceae bacterium]